MIRKDDLDLYDESAGEEFAQKAQTLLRGAFRDGGKSTISRWKLSIDWDAIEPKAVEYGASRGAELIGKKWVDGHLVDNPNAEWAIDATTRDAVRDLVKEAVDEGWSVDDFVDALEDSGIFSDSRAETIARTEIAFAVAIGAAGAFREAGVEHVYIYDGDYDPECQEANGQIWTIDEYEENPIEHPNCVRDARPLTAREEEAA